MTTNKFFPKFVKKILPFAPVVGVVSTCLLVASAVAQVSEPIIQAGWGLQVSEQKPQSLLFIFGSLLSWLLYCAH
jgi:BASS family bile acid:Na+ symporter